MSEEITKALQLTLRALPISEKSLANELFSSEQYYKTSGTVWLRAPVLNLHESIATARSGSKGRDSTEPMFVVRNLIITCDTLIIDSVEPISGKDGVFNIEIWSRRIIAPHATTSSASIVLNLTRDSSVMFGTLQLPASFEIEVRLGARTDRVKPVVETGFFGVEIRASSRDGLQMEQLPAPDSFMNTLSYLNRINENGTLKPSNLQNDDFPRLLQMQMLIAQAHIGINKQLSIELLNYIVAASSCAISLELHFQAASLRNSLLVDSDVVYVPAVNIFSGKQVLKARLAAAKAFEDSFQRFSSLTNDAENRTLLALDLLAKSEDATETYRFLLEVRDREYNQAVTAFQKATTTFSENEKAIEPLKAAFEVGIKKYKKKQEMKAVKSIFKGIFEIGVAIAATVATGGAAAPVAVPFIGKAADTAAKTVSLWTKLKAVFDRLNQVYNRIRPVIQKLQTTLETANKVITELRKFNQRTDSAKALNPEAVSSDVVNATAEWRRFNLTLMDLETTLREYDIQGKAEYFMGLKTLVINGEAFIQAQANLVVKGDELATAMLKSKMEKKDEERLSKMAYKAATDDTIFNLLRRAMFDRLLQIRNLVYSDFSTYWDAYKYHTMLPEQIFSLSPVKPVVDYFEDAAKLQAAVVSFGAQTTIQKRKFEFRTLAGYPSGADLATQLSKGPVVVNVAPTEKIFKGFTRIRMSSVRCFLNGIKSNAGESLQLQLRTNGQFFDRDLMYRAFSTTRELDIGKAILTRSFLGDRRQLLFEYEPSTGAIVCDGQFGQARDYTKQTPITSWTIELAGSKKGRKSSGFDLSGLEELVIEFECEVIWTGVDSAENEGEDEDNEEGEGESQGEGERVGEGEVEEEGDD